MTEKKRDYKRYPEEFKKDAVSLVLEQHYTPQQAADAVGCFVSSSSLMGHLYLKKYT